jgi:hypothetical protein
LEKRGEEEEGVAVGYAPYMGDGCWECVWARVWDRGEVGMRRKSFEGLSMVVRGRIVDMWRHPYMFLS